MGLEEDVDFWDMKVEDEEEKVVIRDLTQESSSTCIRILRDARSYYYSFF